MLIRLISLKFSYISPKKKKKNNTQFHTCTYRDCRPQRSLFPTTTHALKLLFHAHGYSEPHPNLSPNLVNSFPNLFFPSPNLSLARKVFFTQVKNSMVKAKSTSVNVERAFCEFFCVANSMIFLGNKSTKIERKIQKEF